MRLDAVAAHARHISSATWGALTALVLLLAHGVWIALIAIPSGVVGSRLFFIAVGGEARTVQATRMLRGAQPFERFKGLIDTALSEVRPPR